MQSFSEQRVNYEIDLPEARVVLEHIVRGLHGSPQRRHKHGRELILPYIFRRFSALLPSVLGKPRVNQLWVRLDLQPLAERTHWQVDQRFQSLVLNGGGVTDEDHRRGCHDRGQTVVVRHTEGVFYVGLDQLVKAGLGNITEER